MRVAEWVFFFLGFLVEERDREREIYFHTFLSVGNKQNPLAPTVSDLFFSGSVLAAMAGASASAMP